MIHATPGAGMAQHHASEHERASVLRSYKFAVVALIPLVWFYWSIPIETSGEDVYSVLNSVLPWYFLSVLGLLAYRTSQLMTASIWTPLVWFPAQAAIFFGFGPLVEVYGNQFTQEILDAHYLSVTETELFRSHKLSVTGVFLVVSGIACQLGLAKRSWQAPETSKRPAFDPFGIGLAFTMVGLALKYLFLKPAEWAIIDFLVPGILSGLGGLVDLGLAILAYCAARGDFRARALVVYILPVHVVLSALSMSKLEVTMALLLPAVGAYVGKRDNRKLLTQLSVVAFLFAISQNYVHFGREIIYERTGTISEAGYTERAAILSRYLTNTEEVRNIYHDGREEHQGWWARLSFAGPQARAMELYDRGFANPTLNTAWVYFIPRAIWPDKPILYGPGLNFYRLLTGREDAVSFLGLSIYGDLYWQYGWTGLLVGCPLFGLLLGYLASRSVHIVRSQEYIMMPYVALVLQLSLMGPNKYVLNGIVGVVPIIFAYYLLFRFITSLRSRVREIDNTVLQPGE